jgi:hypothetical protein
VIFAGLRAAFNPLRPWLPTPNLYWARIAVEYVATAIPVVLAFEVARRLAKIQADYSSFRQKVGNFNVNLVEVGKSLEERVDKQGKQLETLGERLKYIEGKVGDQLTDILTKQLLEQEGLKTEETRRSLGVPPDDVRVANARKVLREAVQEAQNVIDAKNIDQATVQAALEWQIQNLIAEVFSFRVFADFRNFMEITSKKRELSGTPANGKKHLAKYAQYLEELADGLGPKDLDPEKEPPASWAQWKKAHS